MRGALALLLVAAATGCVRPATQFTCHGDGECVSAGQLGTCEPSGECSFPDDACPSGRRFAALDTAAHANQCVDAEATDAGEPADLEPACVPSSLPDGGTTCGVADGGSLCCGAACNPLVACAPSASCGCVVTLVGGTNHACALRADGTVACWGKNDFAQLGDDTFTGSFSTVPRPIHPALDGVVELVSGGAFLCARRTGGTVWCWGNNNQGELGVATIKTRPAAAQVPGLPDAKTNPAVRIAAGHFHACAQLLDGSVWCWGGDAFGQLGDMQSGMNLLRVTPAPVPFAQPPVAIAGAGSQTFAIMADRSLVGLGDNTYGQLAQDPSKVKQLLVPTTIFTDVTALAAGDNHTCVRRSDGTVWCFGRNDEGELGLGPPTLARATPMAVLDGRTGQPLLSRRIGGGPFHTCAVANDGTLLCWGQDERGELGDGKTGSGVFFAATPVQSQGLTNVVDVAGGHNFTLARDAAGALYGFGDQTYGQIGDQVLSATPQTTPAPFGLCCMP